MCTVCLYGCGLRGRPRGLRLRCAPPAQRAAHHAAILSANAAHACEGLPPERAVRKLREAEIEEKYRPAAVSYDEVKARVDQLIEAAEHLGAHD